MKKEELIKNIFILNGEIQRDGGRKIREVSQGEMATLGYLTHEEKESTPTEISKKFKLSTARVANTLNSLEKKGYVERIHETDDRRRVKVRATEAGKELFTKTEIEIIQVITGLVEYLGEDAEKYYELNLKAHEYFAKL